MIRTVLMFTIIFIGSGNVQAQSNFDISGKWSLEKVVMNDTLIKLENRFFTFTETTFEFGKIDRTPIAHGNYNIVNSNSLSLITDDDFPINGTFSIVSNTKDSISLENDTINLYLARYKLPSDFIQNSTKSKEEELKGWNSFSVESFDLALEHFKNAYLLDSTNYDAITGLVYSKGAVKDEIDLNLISIISKNTKSTEEGIGLITAAFALQYSTHSEDDFRSEDLNTESVSAFYLGGSYIVYYLNGNPKEKGEYQNKEPTGKWINWRNDGTVFRTIEYSQKDSIKTYTFHKTDGVITTKEIVKVDGNMESTIKRDIFYQELPDERGTYLFVSKTGFCVYDDGEDVTLDISTPDNIIEEVPDLKKGRVWYIWKDGERTIYRECELDGTIIWEYESEKPRKYKWQNCKKVLIEP